MGLSDVDVILACLLVCEVEGAREWEEELADPKSAITDEFRAMLKYGAGIAGALLVLAIGRLIAARRGEAGAAT